MAKITSAGQMVDKRGADSLGREQWDTWPTYDAAVLGFRDYWYPVAWSKSISRKPLALTLLGENVMLLRDQHGQPRALHNRCPHRGVNSHRNSHRRRVIAADLARCF